MTLSDRARRLRIAEHLYALACEVVAVMPEKPRRRVAPIILAVGMRLIREGNEIAMDADVAATAGVVLN